MADNFHFDLTGVSLDSCLKVAFGQYRKAYGWAESPPCQPYAEEEKRNAENPRLVLYWVDPDGAVEGYHPFPAPLTAEATEPFIKAWLEAVKYGPEPDHDGDNKKGWRVYNESWGHIGGRYQAFVAIEPVWLEYGK